MSDDLVKRLREWPCATKEADLMDEAADRLAELEAKLRYYKHEVVETALANEKDAEAKLAKAVGALQAIVRLGDYPQHYSKRYDDIATRALAELKGKTDE